MNEKKRAIITVTVIGVLLFLLIVIGVIKTESRTLKPTENESGNNNVAEYDGQYSTDYKEAFNGEGKKVLYIGSSSCSVCSEFTPQMKYLSEAYDFTYYYVDAATMDTEELTELLEKVGVDIDNFGTPYVAFLENGKKIDEIPGYITESSLFDELQEHEIIGSEESYISSSNASKEETTDDSDESQYPNISFINYSQYEEIYESGEKSIIVLGQTGCGACTAFKPTINEIAQEKNISIYYIDMTALESEDSSKITSLSYFKDKESWGTPLTLIIENKEVVDSQEGAATKEVTLEFFEKNGFGK